MNYTKCYVYTTPRMSATHGILVTVTTSKLTKYNKSVIKTTPWMSATHGILVTILK